MTPTRLPTTSTEFSAGGVVVRGHRSPSGEWSWQCVVIVPTRLAANGAKVLALPKGHPEEGESPGDAALREVREEAGVVARLVEPLGDVRYWYTRNGRRIAKVVTFFLLAYVSGEVEDHDSEVEQARWMALEDAARELSYPGEREMAARALSRTRTA